MENQPLQGWMPKEQIADEAQYDDNVLRRGNQGQPSEPFHESRHQTLRKVTRAEEDIRQIEQPSFELGMEDFRLEHRVQLLVDVRIGEIMLLDQHEDALQGKKADRTANVQGIHQKIRQQNRLVQMREDFLQQKNQQLSVARFVVLPVHYARPRFVDVLTNVRIIQLHLDAEEAG